MIRDLVSLQQQMITGKDNGNVVAQVRNGLFCPTSSLWKSDFNCQDRLGTKTARETQQERNNVVFAQLDALFVMSVSDANTRAMIDADILDCFALTLTQGARKALFCFHLS